MGHWNIVALKSWPVIALTGLQFTAPYKHFWIRGSYIVSLPQILLYVMHFANRIVRNMIIMTITSISNVRNVVPPFALTKRMYLRYNYPKVMRHTISMLW